MQYTGIAIVLLALHAIGLWALPPPSRSTARARSPIPQTDILAIVTVAPVPTPSNIPVPADEDPTLIVPSAGLVTNASRHAEIQSQARNLLYKFPSHRVAQRARLPLWPITTRTVTANTTLFRTDTTVFSSTTVYTTVNHTGTARPRASTVIESTPTPPAVGTLVQQIRGRQPY
ncbi:hypothetical protein F5Y15DRAFT_428753 [Xylariaceae sp. FL0016]|nr:hypothetical protein F5Y15DRAFT_428753 [Xylariaceae sp. FL0016]